MLGHTNETVGEQFNTDLLRRARDKTLAVIQETAAIIRPGMSENDVKKIIQEVQTNLGATRTWHPPQVRFSANTLLPFGVPGKENQILSEDDIYFLDIGPVFEGHEGDVGRPFAVGSDPEKLRCCQDAEAIWHEVRNHWQEKRVTGAELYKFAEACTERRGWKLSLQKANGHRIADFPHAARIRGSIEGFEQTPATDRWILEIQIRHPEKPFGAFYEDLLN